MNQTPQETESGATQGDIKAQGIRILDIGILGPLMIFSALNKEPPPWLKLAMVGMGVGTILYNLKNYLEIQKRLKE